jgi:MFS family permease
MNDSTIEPVRSTGAPGLNSQRRAFRALRHRNYRLFFVGQLISVIGTQMQTTALPLLIIQLQPQDPGLWLGIVGFLPLVPLVPFALVAGSLADRFPKRTILVITQLTMMLQALALGALALSHTIQTWHVLVLSFISGAASAIDVPARQAFVIEMVDDRDDLDSGIALNSAIFNLGRAFGPVLAGVVIALLGFGAAFIINGVTFLAVIVGLWLMRLAPHPKMEKQPRMAAHLSEGLRYVWRHQTLTVLLSLVAVSAFLSAPFITLVPLFVRPEMTLENGTIVPAGPLAASAQPINAWVCSQVRCQDPQAVPYGLLLGAFGVGALLGALLVGIYGNRGRGRLLTLGNLAFPAGLLIFAASRSIWLSMLVLLGVGIVFILQNALANTLVQYSSPDQLRGRVMGIYSILFQGMQGAGRMQAGLTETFTSAPISVAIGAAASLAYGLFVLFRWPAIRKLK